MIKTLADALEQRGYKELTPVQVAVTQPELGDADLLVSAQTGSGKTVGFGLAIAPTLLGGEEMFGPAGSPLALVIAPTRELAMQVKSELSWLYRNAGVSVVSCVGGMDARSERRGLERGAHIVVATPGRLRDHIERKGIDMSELRAVVLDEADEMLDLGFREDLEFILGEAPEERRTLLFSATVPRAIASLAKRYQKDAVRVTTNAEKSQHADIEYRAMHVAVRDAENAVINVLRFYDAQNALVFCNTRAMVNRLTTRFSNRGFLVVALSGELSQTERTHALQAMRDGRARVCVATDVAARGIDLPNLELVVHADLPINSETLLHRSGRTGRAGRKGVSAVIVPGNARRKAERLLGNAKVRAEWVNPPTAEEVLRKDEERLLADPSWSEEISEDEQDFVTRLTAEHSAEQIAAAYIRLARSRQSAPEDLSPPLAEGERPVREQREPFGPSIWFAVSVGRAQNAEVRWILPMVCKAGDLTKRDIGAIRIQQTETFVEVLAKSVPNFLKAVGPEMSLEAGAKLRQLDGPPDLSAEPRPAQRDRPPRPERSEHRPERKREDRAAPRSTYRPENDAPRPAPAEKPRVAAVEKPRAAAERSRAPVDKPRATTDKPRAATDKPRTPTVKSNIVTDKPLNPAAAKPYRKRDSSDGPAGKPAIGAKKKSDKHPSRKGKPNSAGPELSTRKPPTRGGDAVPRRPKPPKRG